VEVLKFILKSLLDGKNFPIPEFGYLEVRAVSGRKTVFFVPKTTDNESYASQLEGYDKRGIETLITKPLKEGKEVSLPETGVFKPFVKSDGSVKVSFIPSPALRSKLNGTVTEAHYVSAEAEPAFTSKESIPESEPVSRNEEPVTSEIFPVREKDEERVSVSKRGDEKPSKLKMSKVGDTIVPDDEDRSSSGKRRHSSGGGVAKKRNVAGWLLGIVSVLAVVVILFNVFNQGPKKLDEMNSIDDKDDSYNFPDLAKEHYGNPVYWVYIYEANKDRLHLKSPVNVIVSDTASLVIPDLQAESVDLTDSMEIRVASLMGDMILEKLNK
jgi:nucleoid DNA-binding protein